MTSYYLGALCALIATRSASLFADGHGVLADLRFWLYLSAASALMVSCMDPVPALGY